MSLLKSIAPFAAYGLLAVMMPCLAPGQSAVLDQKVEALLAKMTLEEKAGQMNNISLMALAKGDFWMKRDTVELDTSKVRRLLVEHHVGSVQNLGTYPFAPDEWRKLIGIVQDAAKNETRLGIPILYGIDAAHGANYSAGSTLFPHQLGMAATWNPDLVAKGAAITSYEMKACGIPWNYAPVLDVSKQALWGRIFETYGEDTYLATAMGDAYVRGAQGKNIADDHSAAVCLKHFWGYGMPANGKDRSPTYLPERMLRQAHLPPFASAIEQGALSVMINSGSVNGVPSHADHHLITGILKGELGFEGFTISDWEDVRGLHSVHQVAMDEKDAVRIAVNAGLDMCMDPYDATFAIYLVEHVRSGNVKMERVDDAVRRILRVKFKLGLFEQNMSDSSLFSKYGGAEHAQAALESALESMTLLKNDNKVLPLQKGKKVLVSGVAAHSLTAINGAWSRTWSGQDSSFNDVGKQTILDAIRLENGKENVVYAQGSTYDSITNLDAAVRAARDVDYIVLCLGEQPATEKPSDIDDLNMPEAQRNLAKALAATGKPLILVLVEARPRIISDIEPLAQGILMAYLPGNEGGRAIAQTLFGVHNPSGKLPLTYPRHHASLWAYDHTRADARDAEFGFEGFKPQYEFGHGMSYTDFVYSDLQLNTDTLNGSDKLGVTVKVTNTGSRSGKEVVQVYSSDLVASLVPAVKQLRHFEKIELEAGASKTVRFSLSANDLAFVNLENEWVTEPGAFALHVGGMQKEFIYRKASPDTTLLEINQLRNRKK